MPDSLNLKAIYIKKRTIKTKAVKIWILALIVHKSRLFIRISYTQILKLAKTGLQK